MTQCRGRMGQCDSAGGGWDSVTMQGEDGTVGQCRGRMGQWDTVQGKMGQCDSAGEDGTV